MRRVETNARQPRAHGLVDIGQQATAVGDTGEQAEVGLGHAEGEVGTVWLAPGGDLFAMLKRHAADTAAHMHGAAQAVEGRWVGVVHAKRLLAWRGRGVRIARPIHFMGHGKGDGVGPGGVVHVSLVG
jgi:hypothetical protein